MSTIGIAFRRGISFVLRQIIAPIAKRDNHLDISTVEVKNCLRNFSEATFIQYPGMYYNKLFACWSAWIRYRKNKRTEDFEKAMEYTRDFNSGMYMAFAGSSVKEIHCRIFGDHYWN